MPFSTKCDCILRDGLKLPPVTARQTQLTLTVPARERKPIRCHQSKNKTMMKFHLNTSAE